MVDLDLDELEDVVGRQASQIYAAPGQSRDGQRIRRLLQSLHEAAADILQGSLLSSPASAFCAASEPLLAVCMQIRSISNLLLATLYCVVSQLHTARAACCPFPFFRKHAPELDTNCMGEIGGYICCCWLGFSLPLLHLCMSWDCLIPRQSQHVRLMSHPFPDY